MIWPCLLTPSLELLSSHQVVKGDVLFWPLGFTHCRSPCPECSSPIPIYLMPPILSGISSAPGQPAADLYSLLAFILLHGPSYGHNYQMLCVLLFSRLSL